MPPPSPLGRRCSLVLLMIILMGVLTQVEGVPAAGERSRRVPRWIDGLWKRIRSGYDSMSGSAEQTEKEVTDALNTASQTVTRGVQELLTMQDRHRRSNAPYTPATPATPAAVEMLGGSVYRFDGLDEDVLHHLKTFHSPAHPASMTLFEHRGLIFWLVTETFTNPAGAFLPNAPGRLYVYAARGNKMMSTVVETKGAVKCEVLLKTNLFLDFVCAERLHQQFEDKKNGSGVYRLTWRGKLEVELRRPLATHAVRDLQVWKYKNHRLIAFLNGVQQQQQSGYGGQQVQDVAAVTSTIYRHKSLMVDGSLYTSYNKLEKAAFITRHARGFAKLVIGPRHFLAVANYRGKTGNTETHSEIFVYEDGVGTRLFQRVRTSAARSFASFSFKRGKKEEHFLVVANEYSVNAAGLKNYKTNSVIYKFYNKKFVPFQCIETVSARQWVVYQGPKGEFLLAVVSAQNGVFFYQYNGWRFIQMSFQIRKAGIKAAWMGFVSGLNRGVLTLTHRDAARPLVYYLNFHHFRPAVQEQQHLRWCRSFRLGRDPREVLTRVQAAPKRDQPFTFPGALTIKGNLLLAPVNVVSTIGMITVRDEGYKVDHSFSLLMANIAEVRAAFTRLARARAVVAAALKLEGANLDGFQFANLRFQCGGTGGGGGGGTCLIQNLVANQINGQSVSLDGLVWLNKDQQLSSLNLAHADIGAGVSASVAFLSGPDLPRTHFGDLVTLSGNHSISGHFDFQLVKVARMFVSSTINDIRVDEHSLLLTNTEQAVTADYTVQSLTAQRISLQTLNGQDFTSFLQHLVLNNTDTAITGHLTVTGDVMASSIVSEFAAKPLEPQKVARRALFHSIDSTQVIRGVHTLGGLKVGDLEVGTLNRLSIPRDVYLRGNNETVTRPVIFHTLQANSVRVTGSLGDVKVVNGGLDVVLRHGDQVVSGRKVFKDMVLLGHSTVSLTVSGYRLQNLENTVIEDLVFGLQSGRTIEGEVRFEGEVHVREAVLGGANITHILLHGVPLHASAIPATFIFEAPVKVVGDTRVTSHLNNKRVDLYALLSGTHVFSRGVVFASDVIAEGDLHVATTVNGVNLRELHRLVAMTDSSTMTVKQDITLHSPSFRAGLRVRGGSVVVAGVDLQDLVLRDTDAVITGTKTFPSVKVSGVSAGQVVVAQGGRVDGVVLEDLFFGNTLRKTGREVQRLVGRSLNVVVAASITGTQLGAFEKTVIYRDAASERLGGSLRFLGPVTVQDLTFAGTFDGVSAEEYRSAWLLKTGDQVLTGHNVIQSLDALELTFTGRTLQGVDFERLAKNTAKIDEATVLHSLAFGQVMSNAEVVVNGTVQGLKLSEEVVTRTAATQTITGKKVFQARVHYRGEFSVEQHVVVRSDPHDERPLAIDIEEFCSAAISATAGPTRIRRWIIKGDARFAKNVTVLDSFNGESVAGLANSFWMVNAPTTIPAMTFLAHVEARGNFDVQIAGKTNGQSLNDVWRQLLKRECEAQTVAGQLTVHTLTLDNLATPKLTNPNDDLRIGDLNILLVDGDQVMRGLLNVSSVEAQEIALEGTINGLRVNTDLVLHGRHNVITARKTFAHLTILGDLAMVEGGTVQGVDVSELRKLAAKRAGQGEVVVVPGLTTLRSLVYTGSHFQVKGRVDGVFLRRDTVLLRTGQQEMIAELEVRPDTAGLPAVEAGLLLVLDNRFNGVDLDRLQNRTVRTDRRATIQQSVTFSGVCRFNSIILESQLINGVHLRELADLIHANYLIRLGDHLGAALHAARSTREVMAVKGAEIWYYEELPFPTVAKVVAVTLKATRLEAGVSDALVGIDMTHDAVYTFNMAVPFTKLYSDVRVLEPIAVAGLGSGLLATCGRQPMEATPAGVHQLAHFRVIHLEGGTGTGYGHIYSLASNGGLAAAFETRECRDLVSFQLPDGKVCVAVVNYRAATTVLCGSTSTGFYLLNRLDTTRGAKGVWVTFNGEEMLLVAQEPGQTEPGVLDYYKYSSALNKMVLVHQTHETVSSHVAAHTLGSVMLVAVTGRRTPLCDTFVEVFATNSTDKIYRVQRLEVPEAVHTNLIHLHSGEVVLMVQTRHSLYHYYLRGTKFVFVREIKTASSLCPWSTPFLAGDPLTLLIAHAGLGAYQEDYKGAKLLPVPSRVYRAVYRGPSLDTLYRGSSHVSAALHAHHPHSPDSSHYYHHS